MDFRGFGVVTIEKTFFFLIQHNRTESSFKLWGFMQINVVKFLYVMTGRASFWYHFGLLFEIINLVLKKTPENSIFWLKFVV